MSPCQKIHPFQPLVGERGAIQHLQDLMVRLSTNRVMLLSRLKALGVAKLTDRQKIANALGKALRQQQQEAEPSSEPPVPEASVRAPTGSSA